MCKCQDLRQLLGSSFDFVAFLGLWLLLIGGKVLDSRKAGAILWLLFRKEMDGKRCTVELCNNRDLVLQYPQSSGMDMGPRKVPLLKAENNGISTCQEVENMFV